MELLIDIFIFRGSGSFLNHAFRAGTLATALPNFGSSRHRQFSFITQRIFGVNFP
jgi:hypothetical protein